MASLALVRALSVDPHVGMRPPRVLSSSVIDRMKTIHEDQLLGPASPAPRRKSRGATFTYGTTSEHYGFGPHSFDKSSERTRLLAHHEEAEEGRMAVTSNRTPGRRALVAGTALSTVLCMVAQIVSLPLYMDAMSKRVSGSDAFVASFLAALWQPVILFSFIFFFVFMAGGRRTGVFLPTVPWTNVVVAGVLGGLSGILVAFTSRPTRTQPGIQAVLQQLSVPCTVLTRFLLLRKGINWRQLACVCTLGVGIFITLEPAVFGMMQVGPRAFRDEPNPHAWYFYVIYGFAQLPLAFSYVLMEQGQRHSQVETVAYAAWYQLIVFLSYFMFVWIDFIPGFGMADADSSSFMEKLNNGFLCFYAVDETCGAVVPLAIIYTLSTAGTTLASILLIRFAEGAVFTVLVMTFATPLATLFWTLFSADAGLHWAPAHDVSAAFPLAGVAIMTPSVAMYAFFWDAESFAGPNMDPEAQRQWQEAVAAEKRRILQERARAARRQRRQHAATYNGQRGTRPGLPTLGTSRKKSLHRVRSAPIMYGGF